MKKITSRKLVSITRKIKQVGRVKEMHSDGEPYWCLIVGEQRRTTNCKPPSEPVVVSWGPRVMVKSQRPTWLIKSWWLFDLLASRMLVEQSEPHPKSDVKKQTFTKIL